MLADFLYSLSAQITMFNVFRYITVRSALSFITALIICWFFGEKFIQFLKNKQIGETIRSDGPTSHFSKKGTPTMGGVMIIFAVLFSSILWGKWTNLYFLLAIFAFTWMGIVGFIDDYIKVFKKNKEGLAGRIKLISQIVLAFIIAYMISTHSYFDGTQRLVTSVPFMKDTVINFGSTWLYVVFVIFVLSGTSNGVNLTDGLDGLAAGTSAVAMFGFAIIAYMSGNVIISDYLNILYLPGTGELAIFAVAVIGALVGFLWYNSYPAQVFMGDTGSLAIGSIIATMAILLKKELWLLLIGGIFFVETLSVLIQTGYFKYSKKRFGIGKRVFLMAPIHHHYEKKGIPEAKIVNRFWVISVLLLLLTFLTFKTQ